MKKGNFFYYNIVMKLTIYTKPYDDEKIKFNTITGRYELTIQAVKSACDVNFKDDATLEKRITQTSRIIYNYLFSRSYSGNKQVVQFLLDRTEEGRKFLFEILMAQMLADNETAYNDLTKLPSINMSTGQAFDRNVIYSNRVCLDAETIADNNDVYFGVNILVQIRFPFDMFRMVQLYAK